MGAVQIDRNDAAKYVSQDHILPVSPTTQGAICYSVVPRPDGGAEAEGSDFDMLGDAVVMAAHMAKTLSLFAPWYVVAIHEDGDCVDVGYVEMLPNEQGELHADWHWSAPGIGEGWDKIEGDEQPEDEHDEPETADTDPSSPWFEGFRETGAPTNA